MNRTTEQSRKQLDPAKTRADILEAAIRMFAEKGFSGASIGEIAKAASVPKSLVQYHFESKERLFQTCVQSRMDRSLAAIDLALGQGQPDLGKILATRYDFLSRNPEMLRILSWASLEPLPFPEVIEERLATLQEAFGGTSAPERLLPFLLAISAMDGWLTHKRVYAHLFGDWVLRPEIEKQVKENLLKTVTGERK